MEPSTGIDITSPALTTLFIALVYALIRVVNYLIAKKTGSDKVELADDQKKTIEATGGSVGEILRISKRMDELHNVYDSNHTPKWYFSSDTIPLLRKVDFDLTTLSRENHSVMNEIKSGQSILVDKLMDLINTQRLMTERLGDLLRKLDKLTEK